MTCPATGNSAARIPGSPCGLARRLGAMTYDGMLLFAVLFVATLAVLPLTEGDAIPSGNPLYAGYLLLITYLYFAGQWVRGGRTLGMRAWRIRLLARDGGAWQVTQAKFLSPSGPGDELFFLLQDGVRGGVSFVVRCGERDVASGNLQPSIP